MRDRFAEFRERATTPRDGVYIDTDDQWVGRYRSRAHNYVCLLPCVVIRRPRRTEGPVWDDGDPWKDWTLVTDDDGHRWAVYSRLRESDVIVSIGLRSERERMVFNISEGEAVIDGRDVTGPPGYRMVRQATRLTPGAERWGGYPPHYVRGMAPETAEEADA